MISQNTEKSSGNSNSPEKPSAYASGKTLKEVNTTTTTTYDNNPSGWRKLGKKTKIQTMCRCLTLKMLVLWIS